MKHPERWLHYFWGDEEIFRELQPHGNNRDARFKINAEIGLCSLGSIQCNKSTHKSLSKMDS